MTAEEMAAYIEAKPESPEAKAFKDWAGDGCKDMNRDPEGPRAKAFTEALGKIKFYANRAPVFRGL